LARANPSDTFRAVLIEQRLELERENLERVVPVARGQFARRRIAQQWSRGAVARGKWCEGFPAFGAGHAEIDRVIRIGGEIDCMAANSSKTPPTTPKSKRSPKMGRSSSVWRSAVRRNWRLVARSSFAYFSTIDSQASLSRVAEISEMASEGTGCKAKPTARPN